MKKLTMILSLFAVAACSTSEKQVAEIIKKNPEIVFNTIEENPEKFIDIVNKAARKAQENYQQKQFSDAKKQQEEQMKAPLKPALSAERMLSGSKNAEIVIVEYADFQCPACRMAYENLKPIKEKYKDKIQFYYKNMPLSFHKMAMPAATYYEAIALQDKAKAKKYYAALFENQRQMADEEFLKSAAKKVGADMKKLAVDINGDTVKKRIEADMAEFEKFGFTGTPVLLVNGVALHGAQPAEEIERVIASTKNSREESSSQKSK